MIGRKPGGSGREPLEKRGCITFCPPKPKWCICPNSLNKCTRLSKYKLTWTEYMTGVHGNNVSTSVTMGYRIQHLKIISIMHCLFLISKNAHFWKLGKYRKTFKKLIISHNFTSQRKPLLRVWCISFMTFLRESLLFTHVIEHSFAYFNLILYNFFTSLKWDTNISFYVCSNLTYRSTRIYSAASTRYLELPVFAGINNVTMHIFVHKFLSVFWSIRIES